MERLSGGSTRVRRRSSGLRRPTALLSRIFVLVPSGRGASQGHPCGKAGRETPRTCGRERVRDLGRMPKKTRAAASNAVAVEADSVQPAVQQNRRHLRCALDRHVRLAVDTPTATVRQPVLGPKGGRCGRVLGLVDRRALLGERGSGIVFTDEGLSDGAWSGRGTWSGVCV